MGGQTHIQTMLHSSAIFAWPPENFNVSWNHPSPGLHFPSKESVITAWMSPGPWAPCFQWWEISSYPTYQEMKFPGVGRSRTIHGTALSAEEIVGLNLKYRWTCNFKNIWGNRPSDSDVCSEFQSKISITYTINPSPPSLVAFQSRAAEFPMQDTSGCFPKSQCISKENYQAFHQCSILKIFLDYRYFQK